MRLPVLFVGLLVWSCSDELPPPNADKPSPPDSNDPTYSVGGIHGWYRTSNAAPTADELMTIRVGAPGGTEYVDAWIADLPPVRLTKQPNGELAIQREISEVPAGLHDVLLAADGSTTAFAKV